MGNTSSTKSELYRVRPDEGTSNSTPEKSALERLKALPQLTPTLHRGSEPVWEDLRRLTATADDPARLQMSQEIQNIWEALKKWAQMREAAVHGPQAELHDLIEEIAEMTKQLEHCTAQEHAACAQLHQDLEAAHQLREKVESLAHQLDSFNSRLHKL